MTNYLRRGDTRPFRRNPNVGLSWRPLIQAPIRWLPRHGDPFCVLEWISQKAIKTLAYLPVYIAVVTTITLIVLIFSVSHW
jgi:hypothetical protein